MLEGMEKNVGGRPSINPLQVERGLPTYKEMGMEKHGDGRPKTVATSDGSDLTWEDLGLVRQQSTDGTGYIKGLPVQWAIAPV